MVLHGLPKVAGVQRMEPRLSFKPDPPSLRCPKRRNHIRQRLEYLSRRREELVDVFQRSISDDVVALSITSSCASRIIDCPEKVQEKDN